jgi:hypothetical protein
LLVEPSAENVATYSEDWTNYWNPALNVTLSGNVSGTTDPYGTNVADAMFETTANDNHAIFADYTVASGTTYTFSFFVKSIIARNVRINGATNLPGQSIDVNLSTLAISGAGSGTCRVLNFGNGWARVSQTYTATGTGNGRFIIYSMSGTTQSFQGSTNNGLYLFGAQLEVGSVATSYIPTTAAAVTRNADVVTLSGAVSGSIGQTEGTIYTEVDTRIYTGISSRRIISLRIDGSNLISLEIVGSNGLNFIVASGGVNVSLAYTIPSDGVYKIAGAYNSAASGTVLYVNGTLRDTKTTAIPTLSAAVFGLGVRGDGGAGTQFGDRIRAAAFYTTRLTDAELATLTTL